jgi:hypothetical protein
LALGYGLAGGDVREGVLVEEIHRVFGAFSDECVLLLAAFGALSVLLRLFFCIGI